MTDRPIIFSGEMVRAILEGRKTQTRRPVIRYGNSSVKRVLGPTKDGFFDFIFPEERGSSKDGIGHLVKCPFGQVGDRLWVRETFCLEHQVERDDLPPFDDGRPIRWEYEGAECDPEGADTWLQPHYRATDPPPELAYEDSDGEPTVRWKPSIHMPRWASRITLEITEIRVERLQEITEEGARAEGARKFTNLPPDPSLYPYGNEPRWSMEEPKSVRECLGSARYAFANLWERLYAKKGLGWYANPWVWVITFRRVEG